MRPVIRMDHGAVGFAMFGGELSGRRARRNLMRNNLELGVDWPSLNQPDDYIRRRQPGAMREVNGYRVSGMADAAVLVFEGPVVPVACGLQRKRHHQNRHNDGEGLVYCSAWQVQIQFPLKDSS